MQQETLLILYVAVGVACGALHYHRGAGRGLHRIASAVAMVALWPLWAPFGLSPAPPPRGPYGSRILLALERLGSIEGADAGAGVLEAREVSALMRQVDAAERRILELEAQLAFLRYDPPGIDAGTGTDARARLRASSITKLEALRDRERAALADLAEMCELLRAQYLVNHFSGVAQDEAREVLWARVQALAVLGTDAF